MQSDNFDAINAAMEQIRNSNFKRTYVRFMKNIIDTRGQTKHIEFTGQLLDYKEFMQYSDTLVESGNAAGDGIQRAIDAGFKNIYGIEASQQYYDLCLNKFVKQIQKSDVLLFHGKSVDRLPDILQLLEKPCVFYLDAHVSGETSFGYDDWIKNGEESEGAQDKTIKAELALILAHSQKHVIIIDDVNGLKDGHAYEYMEQILAVNPEYKFYFYDECLSGDKEFYYTDKLLIAIP